MCAAELSLDCGHGRHGHKRNQTRDAQNLRGACRPVCTMLGRNARWSIQLSRCVDADDARLVDRPPVPGLTHVVVSFSALSVLAAASSCDVWHGKDGRHLQQGAVRPLQETWEKVAVQ